MSEENRKKQNKSAASTAAGAVRTGKAIANIAKGAAAGGVYGAALGAAKSAKKWLVPVAALLLLPVIIVTMLPTIIFGSILSTDEPSSTPNGIVDDTVLTQNMFDMNNSISSVLSEGLTDVLERIQEDFETSGCNEMEVNNPYGSDVRFNASYFISLYCASKDEDIESLSQSDMIAILSKNKDKLYSFTYEDTSTLVEVTPDPPPSDAESEGEEPASPPAPVYVTVTTRTYTISYNGEAYFADEIFGLSETQKALASDYSRNLSILLRDGSYQVLSATEFTDLGMSFEGIVFSDGATPVVYYNQYDDRWKDLPYGTDNIGGYACGPTAMAIVVSSLTSESVDPPHMAQWAYENGHWCSGSGSYHSVVPGAAQAWGLSCEACPKDDPQRLVDALANGKLVVAIMGPGHFTSGGHFIVLRGVTADGKIMVADPASYRRSEEGWDLSLIIDESSRYAVDNSPFWIIGS